MSSNGSTQTTSKLLLDLAKDHVELASLEWEYSKGKWWRQLLVRGGGVIIFLTSYIFFQIALVGALRNAGMALVSIGLLMGLAYAAAGSAIVWVLKKKRAKEEPPMKGTKDELQRSFHWIEKHFL